MIYPQTIASSIVQIQLRAMAFHQMHIGWPHIGEQHHITVSSGVVHITDLFLVATHPDHIHIIPDAAIQVVVATAGDQPIAA